MAVENKFRLTVAPNVRSIESSKSKYLFYFGVWGGLDASSTNWEAIERVAVRS
jgi:hypothetical protein